MSSPQMAEVGENTALKEPRKGAELPFYTTPQAHGGSSSPSKASAKAADEDEPRSLAIWTRRVLLTLLALLCANTLYLSVLQLLSHKSSNKGNGSQAPAAFNWTAHEPSAELHWYPCHGQFQCARLSVPLDYTNPEEGNAAVALVRVPSLLPPSSPEYKGPILFNPGGPGGSGVSIILGLGHAFQALLGPQFDIIGFDPRGVGFTTPTLNVFPSANYLSPEEAEWLAQSNPGGAGGAGVPFINSTETAVGIHVARAKIFAGMVEMGLGRSGGMRPKKVAQYVGTVNVAKDMLSIVKAHGREKLMYWGFSYGTILGATFAAMFPDNVERLIIDGVADPFDYYSVQWLNNLVDTEATLQNIYASCASAGPSICPIYEKTAELVNARVERLAAKLDRAPMPYTYPDPTGATPFLYGAITGDTVRGALFTTLYSPYTGGADLFSIIAAIEQANLELYFEITARMDRLKLKWKFPDKVSTVGFRTSRSVSTLSDSDWDHIERSDVSSGQRAILCGDGDSPFSPHGNAVDELEAHSERLVRVSPHFGGLWAMIRGMCAGWTTEANERFRGSFNKRTSFPLLVIGNTHDPVTPLANARNISSEFQNAVLLTQKSAGHCSIAKDGTVCEVSSEIFPKEKVEEVVTTSVEDRNMLNAWKTISESYPVSPVAW